MKKYVYPKIGKRDLFFFRIGGAGLGNLLFTYAEALVISKKYNLKIIWPTWNTIPITRDEMIIRKAKDKRSYMAMFKNNSNYISGIRKAAILIKSKKIFNPINIEKVEEEVIVIEKGKIQYTGELYKNLREYRYQIYEDLYKNLTEKSKQKLNDIDISDGIVVQIRMTDFKKASIEELKKGIDNARIPLEWFENIIKQIRKIAKKNVKVYLMSDGKDNELQPIFKLGNVERLELGNSISNILAMSKSKLMVVSGSTFSLWARFLGQMSSISYKNQYKEKVLEDKSKFEIDIEEKIDKKYYQQIYNYFN